MNHEIGDVVYTHREINAVAAVDDDGDDLLMIIQPSHAEVLGYVPTSITETTFRYMVELYLTGLVIGHRRAVHGR